MTSGSRSSALSPADQGLQRHPGPRREQVRQGAVRAAAGREPPRRRRLDPPAARSGAPRRGRQGARRCVEDRGFALTPDADEEPSMPPSRHEGMRLERPDAQPRWPPCVIGFICVTGLVGVLRVAPARARSAVRGGPVVHRHWVRHGGRRPLLAVPIGLSGRRETPDRVWCRTAPRGKRLPHARPRRREFRRRPDTPEAATREGLPVRRSLRSG